MSAAMLVGPGVLVPSTMSALAACYPECEAPVMLGGGGSSSQTAAFVGLQWNFGSQTPEVTGGVRYLTSNDDGLVYGAQGDISLPFMAAEFGPTIRVLGLAGNSDVQAQAGFGYDFATSLPLLAVGVQASYFDAGANIELGGNANGYFGLNTLAKPPLGGGGGELVCTNPSYTLVDVVGGYAESFPVDPIYVVDDKTCVSQN